MSADTRALAKRGCIAEAVRQDETLRYGASLLAESVINDTAHALEPALLRVSLDATLAAFAQLATLRLRVDRAIISLFDGKRQHIVAEATPTTPIEENPDDYSADSATHGLIMSGTAIPRMHGSCEYTLDLPAEHDLSGRPLLPISVVDDLTKDDRFSTRPYFHPGSSLRFYAAVPLRTPQGIDIGVCAIYDSVPGDRLNDECRKFLRHFSRLVMSHLQSRVSTESYRRHERMVRGLGSLIEGTGSMSNWRETPNPQSFHDISGLEGKLNARQQYLQGQFGDDPQQQQPQQQQQQHEKHNSNSSNKARPDLAPIQSHDPEKANQEPTKEASRPGAANYSTDGIDSDTDDKVQSRDSGVHNSEGIASDAGMAPPKSTFSRAANIIRESIEVEGSLFLDASIGSFGGLVPQTQRRASSQARSQQGSASSSDAESIMTDDSTTGMRYCQILGFSSSESSSVNGESAPNAFTSIPDTFLEKILRRYPRGQVFNFDDSGAVIWPVSDSEGSETTTATDAGPSSGTKLPTRVARRPRRSDAAVLIRMFPGARSVALFPVLDPHKERWYAGGFVWTKAASRVFTVEGEISYLMAFGASTMAEIARLEVSRENKAKEDILGSLSHEIRSPLHGVILGVELMHDTMLTAFQEDVLHTVETCGRTLLETLDHLLDFSKVNNFLRTPKRSGTFGHNRGVGMDGIGRSNIEAGMMSIFSEVTLDLLLEEVIESVYAGHSFQKTSNDWANRERQKSASYFDYAGTMRRLESVRQMDTSSGSGSVTPTSPFPVGIYLSIDPDVAWDFRAQPGALRRVIMNIFGNALKFTTQGSILVSLTQEPTSTKKKNRWRTIVLTVSDSGRGISSDFLHNRLYSPFAQENQLSPGAGLGLSIVKQIVHGLGGRVAVESRVRHGTTVRVIIPLRRSNPTSSSADMTYNPNDDLEVLTQEFEGCSVSLIGFSEDFGEHQPLAITSTEPRPCPRLLLQTMCQRYLGLRTVPADEAYSDPPTFFICAEAALARVPKLDKMPPVVVACDSVLTAHELAARYPPARSSVIECFSQPVGPRKLAKILALTLRRYRNPEATDSVFAPASPTEAKTPLEFATPGQEPILALGQRPSRSRGGSAPSIPLSVPTRGPVPRPALADWVPRNGAAATLSVRPPLRKELVQSSPKQHEEEDIDQEEMGKEKENGEPDPGSYLLVDDNAINLKILASYMKKLSRSYEQASNGREAVEFCVARSLHYRCIFMDISMPVMDGLEATRLIRAYEQENELKPALIIALTGLASAQTQQEAYASGIDLFLTKPVPLKELGRILQSKGV
ncbi:hypothetical protein BD289DRAFT_45794 [Coniella lustricola]|uniref:Uncharacterized protein n=1 Tax=Coniella lustricola TaxID=2025994 RepID=A0A2T3A1I6_9PEZI|nr:hypothetical protein BD289DRAFT_45794 [Coniella lustricola]